MVRMNTPLLSRPLESAVRPASLGHNLAVRPAVELCRGVNDSAKELEGNRGQNQWTSDGTQNHHDIEFLWDAIATW